MLNINISYQAKNHICFYLCFFFFLIFEIFVFLSQKNRNFSSEKPSVNDDDHNKHSIPILRSPSAEKGKKRIPSEDDGI